jgi:hypothetical protein
MKRIPEAVKRRIVEHLACYRTHAEVTDLIREEFGVSLTPRHVRAYDPTCFQFSGGASRQEYHALVRKRFETEIGEIPIANRAVRLRRLDAIYEKQVIKGDLGAARDTLRQAAEEVGNVYTNVSKTAGTMLVASASDLTPEERRNMLADRLRAAAEKIPAALVARRTNPHGLVGHRGLIAQGPKT